MKLTEHIKIFSELLNQWDSKIRIKTIYPLPISGSKRQYFRIETNRQSVIGCYNDDIIENEAFFHFTDKFLGAGLFVPKLYHIHTNKQYYLLQDLGNETLFLKLTKSQNFNTEILPLYKMAITALIQFQIEGGKIIDFSKAYPRDTFDQQSILWDLSYFKYYWLKFSDISFNEQLLENDFRTFADYLLSLPHNFFLYR
ncbi:MAG TPA: phosphotransferase enzyme family protein, partial [Bacteroidales bacterium]|nr:phosphotransferase enzyme family protein [Bacteroidales bacterium]